MVSKCGKAEAGREDGIRTMLAAGDSALSI
jgi:hypothetical protein